MTRTLPLLVLFILQSWLVRAQQTPPSIVWQKCIGGSKDDKGYAMARTVDNGFIVVGSTLSNDGDVSGHHGAVDSTDALIVKVSSTGNVEWSKSMGGSGNDVFLSIVATQDGGFICGGTTMSNNGDVTGYHGGGVEDIWLVKISRNGDLLWSKCYGGTKRELLGNVKENPDGSIGMIGTTYSFDGDIKNHHTLVIPSSTQDIWFLNLSPAGAIIWQKCFGGTRDDYGYDFSATANGGFFLAVECNSDDGDFGVGGGNPSRGYIIKLTNDTIFSSKTLHQRSKFRQVTRFQSLYYFTNDFTTCYPNNPAFGTVIQTGNDGVVGTGPTYNADISKCYPTLSMGTTPYYQITGPYSLAVNTTGAVVAMTGNDSSAIPGYRHGFTDGVIAGLADNAGVVWRKFIGGSKRDELISSTLLEQNEFMVLGSTQSTDLDVSGNHGGYDMWLVKMGKTNRITGRVFYDYNKNGLQDAGESPLDRILIQSDRGAAQFGSVSSNGFYGHNVDSGIYVTKVATPVKYYTAVPATKTSSFIGYQNTDSIHFALQPIPSQRDYAISAYFTGGPGRPGDDMNYVIQFINNGTDTLSNRTVKMAKDSRLQFVSATITPTSVSNDTIIWVIPSLLPNQHAKIIVKCSAPLPPVLNAFDTVSNEYFIDSTGDLFTKDNRFLTRQGINNSHDPNDKAEVKLGKFTVQDLDNQQFLTYVVRFQNTGNDTAFNVSVRDTLDARLDYTTLEIIDASHAYQFTTHNQRELLWTFNNIRLVDSVHNEPLSNGYIVYRVKPIAGLSVGDSIANSATIYFDFNPGVRTNTQLTVIGARPIALPQPIVTRLKSSYCQLNGLQKGLIANLPPTGTIVKLDNVPLSVEADSSFSFNISDLAEGTHSLSVTFNAGNSSTNVTSLFQVVLPVTPAVKLSADKTIVTTQDAPVQLKAMAISGEGSAPLYTFSRDRNFNNLIQQEGLLSSAQIIPSDLQVGDNFIYVRMKTSDSCAVAANATDSVVVKRTAGKGMVDPDFPTEIIVTYPNPFAGVIHLSGLHADKIYSVVLTNAKGQIVYKQQINNQSEFTIRLKTASRGDYWLSLYDTRKNSRIGTIKLMRE